MNITQANKLIEEYNAIEAEQTERLRALFDFVNARKGYRAVKFGQSEMWSNCWGISTLKTNVHRQFVDSLARPITEFVPGEE
jgi:hypothetical protein